MDQVNDYYHLVGVSPEADIEQIRAEYLARARQLHPDRIHADDAVSLAAANRDMALLNEAWSVLSDPGRRRAYDAARRPPAKPPLHRAARGAGAWLGNLVSEYRKGRSGAP